MSRIIVDSLRGNSASSDAISLANDGTCTANITNNLSNRNLIINGSQIIDQRNSGSNVTAHLAYPTDRFRIIKDTSSGSFTAARSTDAPSGFKNSLLFTTGTAYTPSSSENNFIKYVIEGNDSAQLEFGNSGAKTITLSFYVKSSLTGNFAASIVNGASDRSFPFSYSISSADTWTRITKTITGDTTGTWATDTGAGMQVTWALGVGSNYEGTADSWQGSAEYAVSGHVKVTSTASATFAITGVQLEVSDYATSFEHRSFRDELAKCQRYYFKLTGDDNDFLLSGFTYSASLYYFIVDFPQVMRAFPSYTGSATAARFFTDNPSQDFNLNTLTIAAQATTTYPSSMWLHADQGGAGVASGGVLQPQNAVGTLEFSSEL